MSLNGLAGGGLMKSGEYPRSAISATAGSSAIPSSRPLSDFSHGRCSAAVDGSRNASSECTSSHIGEIAKRIRARSSTVKTKRTTAGGTLRRGDDDLHRPCRRGR